MGYGYLLTRSVIEPVDARVAVTFSAGPWAQMVSFKEGGLRSTSAAARTVLGLEPGDVLDDLVYGLPPIPIPHTPKIIVPPIDSLVAIVLARIAPGQIRSFLGTLDESVVTGAAHLVAPYGHALLDITADSEDRLLEALDEVLDRPELLRAKVGIALADDVAYLDPAG